MPSSLETRSGMCFPPQRRGPGCAFLPRDTVRDVLSSPETQSGMCLPPQRHGPGCAFHPRDTVRDVPSTPETRSGMCFPSQKQSPDVPSSPETLSRVCLKPPRCILGGHMMKMKYQFHWWRKPEHPEETTELRQVPASASPRDGAGRCLPDERPGGGARLNAAYYSKCFSLGTLGMEGGDKSCQGGSP